MFWPDDKLIWANLSFVVANVESSSSATEAVCKLRICAHNKRRANVQSKLISLLLLLSRSDHLESLKISPNLRLQASTKREHI